MCINNKMNCVFDSKMENIEFARNVVGCFLLPLNLTISYIQEIKTIVSEGVTNAIVHGYKSECNHDVILNMRYDEENIWIEITDFGIGIEDIERARIPLFTTRKDDERSGLGFTIMEIFSDEFDVESKVSSGTKLTIRKRIVYPKDESEREVS